MVIGIPKEIKTEEYRVALTPAGARELVSRGHRLLCEATLGIGSGFSDDEYAETGAELCQREQLFKESDLIVKVKEPIEEEYALFSPAQALFTFLHLAPNPSLTSMLLASGVSAFAYETLEEGGTLPLLTPMSEVAGSMAPIVGSYFMQKPFGGRGVLPAGAAGVPPANALILGAGVVGSSALKIAHAMGSRVTVLNRGEEKLRRIDRDYKGGVRTARLTGDNIVSQLREADLVVGATYVHGARTPNLVTRDMLELMRKGAVVVDVSIDQGGCFETSRPTTHLEPTYEVDGIIHYAVANMPGAYPRTSTIALTNATLPYLIRLADAGVDKAASKDKALRTALNIYQGKVTHKGLAESTGIKPGNVEL